MSAAPSFHYCLHGLGIRSNLEIPDLDACRTVGEVTDVQVEWLSESRVSGKFGLEAGPNWTDQDPSGGRMKVWTSTPPEGWAIRLRFCYRDSSVTMDIGACGKRVRISQTPGVPIHNAAMLFLGTGIRYVLQLHGRPALHAAAVERDGVAVVLVGAQGAGKSTTAAALAERGCQILCDDLTTLILVDDQWCVYPGVPSLRLGATALKSVGRDKASSAPVWARTRGMTDAEYQGIENKLLVRGTGAPSDPRRRLPLAGIYSLRPRREAAGPPEVGSLTAAESIGELSRHIGAWPVPGREATKSVFQFLSELARSCPVRSVDRPDDLSLLNTVCDSILADVQTLVRTRRAN